MKRLVISVQGVRDNVMKIFGMVSICIKFLKNCGVYVAKNSVCCSLSVSLMVRNIRSSVYCQ